jgi:hypothetical protein
MNVSIAKDFGTKKSPERSGNTRALIEILLEENQGSATPKIVQWCWATNKCTELGYDMSNGFGLRKVFDESNGMIRKLDGVTGSYWEIMI